MFLLSKIKYQVSVSRGSKIICIVICIYLFPLVIFSQEKSQGKQKASRIWTTVQSALIPGLGQMSQDRGGAGITYGSLFFGSLFAYQTQSKAYESSLKNLETSDLFYYMYGATNPETEFISSVVAGKQFITSQLNQRQFIDKRKTLEIKKKKRDETGLFVLGLYIWNIADAWIFYDNKSEKGNSDTMGALWRSAILPGWGQRYQGRKNIGWLYTGSFLITALSTRNQYLEAQIKRDAYLDSANSFLYTTPAVFSLIISNTDQLSNGIAFLNLVQAQNARAKMEIENRENQKLQMAIVGLYLWNLADVFLFADSGSVSYGLSGRPGGLGLQLGLRF